MRQAGNTRPENQTALREGLKHPQSGGRAPHPPPLFYPTPPSPPPPLAMYIPRARTWDYNACSHKQVTASSKACRWFLVKLVLSSSLCRTCFWTLTAKWCDKCFETALLSASLMVTSRSAARRCSITTLTG